MKDDIFIMKQDLYHDDLDCNYFGFWSILESIFGLTNSEIQNIISYKVEEFFNVIPLNPRIIRIYKSTLLEDNHTNLVLSPIPNLYKNE